MATSAAGSYEVNAAYGDNRSATWHGVFAITGRGLAPYHSLTKLGQLEHPATTVMLTENGPAPGLGGDATIAAGEVSDWWVAGYEYPIDTTVTPHAINPPGIGADVAAWHTDLVNVAYADGHVKAVRLDNLVTRDTTLAVNGKSGAYKYFEIEDRN